MCIRDSYITKPYHTGILLARINALLKRAYPDGAQEEVEWRGITLTLSTGTARFKDNETALSKNEQRILYCLMKSKGRILTRDELMNALWQSDEFVDDNTLTVNINRLRRKLEKLGVTDYIKTRRGQGYSV